MVKNKRLLTALIVILALTVPRFLFVKVAEHEEVYFDSDRMPDKPGDMPSWVAMNVLVCDECIDKLTEMIDEKIPIRDSEMNLFYHPVFHRVDVRCPVHPNVTLRRPSDFDWSIKPGDAGNSEKYSIPVNLLELYPRGLRLNPDRMLGFFICLECQKILSDKLASLETAEGESDDLEVLKRKIAGGKSLDGSGFRIMYAIGEVKDYYCVHHHNNKLQNTVEIPVSPTVRKSLPEDTRFITRMYINREGNQKVDMTIVTSGKDKRSIHRPERCLQNQGYFLDDRRAITIRAPDSRLKDIGVMKLRMKRSSVDPDTNEKIVDKLIVFYWYASVEHVTESNLRRLMYTAWDRMVLGKNYHWSYILIYSPLRGDDPKDEERVTKGLYNFMQEFFPKVER